LDPVRTTLLAALVIVTAVLGRVRASDFKDADTLWQTTLAVDPLCWTAEEHLAESAHQQGRNEEAISRYQRSLSLNPDSPNARVNLGELYLEMQPPRLEEAAAQSLAAIRIEPRSAVAHSNLGLAWLQMERFTDAVQEQRLALRLQPALGEVHCHLALALEGLRATDDAAVEARECFRSSPSTAQRLASGLSSQGDALARDGRWRDAELKYRQALRFAPTLKRAEDGLAYVINR
jgi:tetratricopeptide (TPR) repeat protein